MTLPSLRRRPATAAALGFVLVAAALAGCTTPASTDSSGSNAPVPGALAPEVVTGGAGSSGGMVTDTPPVLQSFTSPVTTVDNSGSQSEVFVGEMFDANGERDFVGAVIRITLSGAASGTFTHTVTAEEANSANPEPTTFGSDGFRVYTSQIRDGVLVFKFRYVYPIATPPGTHTFTPSVTPVGGAAVAGPAKFTTVEYFTNIIVSATPVLANGTPALGNNWGQWSAQPGATNVESTNFLKLVNSGQKPTSQVVIDFTEAAFRGTDPEYSIPIASNVEFAWWEGNATSLPSQGTYTWQPANADGSVAASFSGLGKVLFVKYRVKALPEVLAKQSYGASFTVSEVP